MFRGPDHDYWEPPQSPLSRGLVEEIVVAGRAENRAAARRMAAVGRLFEMRRAQRGEHEDWAVDTWAAVGAEVAAALRVSLGKAGSLIGYGLAMLRLPRVAEVFSGGEIDLAMFTTIVYRTELVTDEAAQSLIDALLAGAVADWPSMSRGKLTREIDRLVATVDPDAVRRADERARGREVTFWHNGDGTADLSGRLLSTDAHTLDQRLDALAASVCDGDPRTKAQRRADALGALAAGADRLRCRCGTPTCPAGSVTPSPVVIHVVAEQSTVEGRSDKPAYLMGADTLIPPQLLADLATRARLRPLAAPAGAEPRYRPSRGLADFARARDLTCRAPGCDRPATKCDLDHTVPYGRGGRTHASNTKHLCRLHHILKTFWGWQDRQLPDGTVIWTLPGNQIYTTTPGGAALFPALAAATPPAPGNPPGDAEADSGERAAMMPRRRTTRAQSRAHRIAAERHRNRRERLITTCCPTTGPPPDDADEPPF